MIVQNKYTAVKFVAYLDSLSISLITSLTSSYVKQAQLNNTLVRPLFPLLMSSLHLFGGLLFGLVCQKFSRCCVLSILFGGTIASIACLTMTQDYAIMLLGQAFLGLFKQATGVTTLYLVKLTVLTESAVRTTQLAQLSTINSFGTVLGPIIGSYLFEVHSLLPPLVSCLLYMTGILVSFSGLLEDTEEMEEALVAIDSATAHDREAVKKVSQSCVSIAGNEKGVGGEVMAHFQEYRFSCIRNYMRTESCPALNSIIVLRLAFGFVKSSMQSRNVRGYMRVRFGLPTHHTGHLSSASAALACLTEATLVSPLLKSFAGKEVGLIVACLCVMAAASVTEGHVVDLGQYLLLSLLPHTIALTVALAAAKSIFLSRVSPHHLPKMLTVYSFLDGLADIGAPLYGSLVFSLLGGVRTKPVTAAAHFAVLAVVFCVLHNRECGRGNDDKATPNKKTD